MHAHPAQPADLLLLDTFRLLLAGEEVDLTSPAQRLLAYLALRRRPVQRDHAAEELWLDSSQDRALGSLRSALWRLRQSPCELVRVRGCRLEIAPEVRVDVSEALSWSRRVLNPTLPGEACDIRGLAYVGDILPDWYDDWVTLEREHFRLLRVQALEELCERLTDAARFNEALEAGLTAAHAEPLRESSQRALMRLHLAQGNPAEAIDQYRRFRDRLVHQLGLEPSPRMRDLLMAARAG
jgi:DNA-binding SARP family transcriptional activator